MSPRLRVLSFSLFASLLILCLKWGAYYLSGSVALKTDALESFVNIAAILLALSATYQAQRPADATHPYGHGKIEYFSSAIEGGMLLFAGAYLFYEGIHGLFNHPELHDLSGAFTLSCIGGMLNGALGVWQLRRGKELRSEAIIADARHILSDFYTTTGIVVGLFLVKLTHLGWIDPAMGIAVAILLLVNAAKIIRNSVMVLSDIESPELIGQIVNLLNRAERPPYIIDVHHLRTFRNGPKSFVDIHLVVPEFWNIGKSHDAGEDYCRALASGLKEESEFHPHVEPCWQKYCARCAVEECPVRRAPFTTNHTFSADEVTTPGEDDLQ